MTHLAEKLSPPITKMIRFDHTHVMLTFHRFQTETAPARKQAIANTICLALEIHAQLEEEIFYPALAQVASDNDALKKAKPEHDEMRRLIAELRGMTPDLPAFDRTLQALMRDVIHHVADEETLLLPAAELLLKDRLCELGAQMTKRRLALAGPRIGEITSNTAKAMPGMTLMLAGTLLAGAYLVKRAFAPRETQA
ncbi:MAG TPA: hemerythrin domain-containing protein [Ideonella sp.]|uniref:hemerythrin domain-containing protein n=1 Tax=Ideonella sp. TaxID=1929293 RepID=UPI002C5430B1|nr:hemerythrin domain-containing protein [Ideonella sp.]HSI51447.1 hemerythrin domain-containing protein [Ideonella sp.]